MYRLMINQVTNIGSEGSIELNCIDVIVIMKVRC